jgi:hypothetical protein
MLYQRLQLVRGLVACCWRELLQRLTIAVVRLVSVAVRLSRPLKDVRRQRVATRSSVAQVASVAESGASSGRQAGERWGRACGDRTKSLMGDSNTCSWYTCTEQVFMRQIIAAFGRNDATGPATLSLPDYAAARGTSPSGAGTQQLHPGFGQLGSASKIPNRV